MIELLSSVPDYALPLLALLWAASVLLLILSARNYLACRAERRGAWEQPAQEPFVGVDAPPPAVHHAIRASLLPDGNATLFAAEDQRPGREPSASLVEPEVEGANLREMISARVTRDRTSVQGLADLVRALYLDQSNFSFAAIAELAVDDRQLAQALISQWLADPSAVDYWEAMHALLREPVRMNETVHRG